MVQPGYFFEPRQTVGTCTATWGSQQAGVPAPIKESTRTHVCQVIRLGTESVIRLLQVEKRLSPWFNQPMKT